LPIASFRNCHREIEKRNSAGRLEQAISETTSTRRIALNLNAAGGLVESRRLTAFIRSSHSVLASRTTWIVGNNLSIEAHIEIIQLSHKQI
jgi:hypothetical protein